MKVPKIQLVLLSLALLFTTAITVQAEALDDYISAFTYQERKDMKISSAELLRGDRTRAFIDSTWK